MSKKTYQTPKIQELGSFEATTKAASTGNVLDATFPVNTPVNQLTFS